MKVTIRAFVFGRKEPLFADVVEDEAEAIDRMAERRFSDFDLGNRPYVIEIEFPQVYGQPVTFVRFGTEPRLMKIPIPLSSDDEEIAALLQTLFAQVQTGNMN